MKPEVGQNVTPKVMVNESVLKTPIRLEVNCSVRFKNKLISTASRVLTILQNCYGLGVFSIKHLTWARWVISARSDI